MPTSPSNDRSPALAPVKPRAIRKSLPDAASRITLPLNLDWQFCRAESDAPPDAILAMDNGRWEKVNLPHSVRLDPLNASGGRNFQGICWYSKRLTLDPGWKNKLLHLHFEGAMQVADVWLNGQHLATNRCGYLPFTVNLTPHLRFNSTGNLLLVRLDNRDNPQVPPGKPQRELDFCYFGGLYRNVRLDVLNPLHISDPLLENRPAGGGIFARFTDVTARAATLHLRTDIRNELAAGKRCQVLHQFFAPDGVIVAASRAHQTLSPASLATFEQTLHIDHPQLWHPHHPHLHTLITTLHAGGREIDRQATRLGIRHIRFDPDHGLFINHERFISIGANRHQDHPYVGYALPDSAHWRDVKKLRDAGFTSVRSHYPQSPAFMDACDELGLLAIVSNPGWQFMGEDRFQAQVLQNARTMVRRDRNHSCVILWEAALNETDNRPIAAALHQAVHEEYPGDQCYTAGDHEPAIARDGQPGWDVEYLHNDGRKPYWIREWGDHVDNWSDQQSRSRVRRAWGETPMLVQARSHVGRMDEILRGQKGNGGHGGVARLAGACLWAGIDCQRGYHHQLFHGGVLDLFRIPKFSRHFFASQRPPHIHVPGLDDGPLVFIANFATFLSPTTVTVFSNCDEVRLLLDGREIARKTPDVGHAMPHPPFTFHVECFAHEVSTMYMTGVARVETPPTELKAEGIIAGQIVATHLVHPPGVPARLLLEADLCGRNLLADGSDWIRVHAHICDARGVTCPLADDLVEFSVDAPASIIGGRDIGANPVHAEAGIATILVGASTRPGRFLLRAAAFDLIPAEIEITAVAAP